jgi:Ribbon-helix-helix protein, copG family
MSTKPRLSPDLLGVPKGEAAVDTAAPEEADLPTGYISLTLRVPPPMHEKLRERAYKRRTKVSVLVREALERYLAE